MSRPWPGHEIGIQGDRYYILCHNCKLKSWNPNDVDNRFCGNCHRYHDDEILASILAKEQSG